jgi:hypothetical protein
MASFHNVSNYLIINHPICATNKQINAYYMSANTILLDLTIVIIFYAYQKL